MEYTTLGRTGLTVSVMGLGGGGPSRLGLASGGSEATAEAVVRRALDLGVTFFDTAAGYGTEPILGRALAGASRERLVIATKHGIEAAGEPVAPAAIVAGVEQSLRRLRVETIDLMQLHGVLPEHYDQARENIAPALLELRAAGKIRFLGLTERFNADPGHVMLQRAVHDEPWDVVMVGYNLLNPSARQRVLATCRERGVGTLCMFAVRKALSDAARRRQVIDDLLAAERLDPAELGATDPLDFLLEVAATIPEAAYRFCRHTPGLDVILSGTGSVAHLEENARSLLAPPLPPAVLDRLERLFGAIDHITGQ